MYYENVLSVIKRTEYDLSNSFNLKIKLIGYIIIKIIDIIFIETYKYYLCNLCIDKSQYNFY